MAFKIDKNGNITLIQGDSGTLYITGLATDKNYKVCLAIQNRKRKQIGEELSVNTNKSPSVAFELTGDYTDLLTVPSGECCEIYFYGIKQCTEEGFEDTLLVGNPGIGSLNTITVFPKKVEGV